VSGLERLRKQWVHRIYTGSGLRRVTPYVQFVLMCSFESHQRLEVEEARGCSSSSSSEEEEEEEKVQVKS
jgi:hypothetical protein